MITISFNYLDSDKDLSVDEGPIGITEQEPC